MAERFDWAAVRLAFICDPNKPQLKQFCGNRKIPYSTASKRAAAEKWERDRKAHWKNVEEKATDRVADLQAVVVANDTAQRLTEIRAMQETALRFAGGVIGQEVVYEKPHEAVAAYERLEKLTRLLVGESTENIAVSDARSFARDLLAIVREEVGDRDVLERIAARAAALSVGSGTLGGTAQPLN